MRLCILCFSLLLPWTGWAQDGFIEGQPRLAYWQVGAKLPTVIVLHGGPGLAHNYLRPEFDAFQQTARVIYYDQRGCGQSDTARSYIWQEQVADLKRLIQTLAPGQKVFLAGSTWGCSLAILYTYTYPEDVKGLLLTGPLQWKGQEQSYAQEGLIHRRPDRQTPGCIMLLWPARSSSSISPLGEKRPCCLCWRSSGATCKPTAMRSITPLGRAGGDSPGVLGACP